MAQVTILICLTATLTSGAEPYSRHIFVPFSQATDEILHQETLKKNLTPKYLIVKDGKILTTHAEDGKEAEIKQSMIGMFYFDCQYDNDGNYYINETLYNKIKDKLIQKHQGRLEHFVTKVAEEQVQKGDINLCDPKLFRTYIWDVEDKIYRYPNTLARVPRDEKLPGGKLLYNHKPNPKLSTDTLDTLSAKHKARQEKVK